MADLDDELEQAEDEEEDAGVPTLYNLARAGMEIEIQRFLTLMQQSNGLSDLKAAHVPTVDERTMILAGLGTNMDPEEATAREVLQEWRRLAAVEFDVERAITASVYRELRKRSRDMLDVLDEDTEGFTEFDADYIQSKPYMLPFLQHLAGVFSKAELKKKIGTVSDSSISGPAAKRLKDLLDLRVHPDQVRKGEVLQRLESTLEGIVRDLVGRLLLESLVANALDAEQLPYIREQDYESLAGVVYNFRADFVLPNHDKPKAFIEVRKSSSRHASLYAKDKMFSAINWKGKTPGLLGVLVVDGEWTQETLRVMANVFDYVVPITSLDKLAKDLKAYVVDGDESKLKWLIQFSITKNEATIVNKKR